MPNPAFEERVLDKLDSITEDITDIKVRMAELPQVFVTREEVDEAKKAAELARRWSIGVAISVFAILIPTLTEVFQIGRP